MDEQLLHMMNQDFIHPALDVLMVTLTTAGLGALLAASAILWARALEYAGDDHGYKPISPWQYVFVSLGKSVIEGEKQWDTIVWAEAAEDVLRMLFVPTKANFQRDKGAKAIPPHNAAAFREAAYIDDAIADVVDRYEPVIPNVERAGDDADPLAGL